MKNRRIKNVEEGQQKGKTRSVFYLLHGLASGSDDGSALMDLQMYTSGTQVFVLAFDSQTSARFLIGLGRRDEIAAGKSKYTFSGANRSLAQ